MNKICTKIAGILFANKSKVHFVLPKSLNLYFKDSISPDLKFINLNNIANIDFIIKEDKESNLFSLVATIVYKNATSTELVIAKFKEQKEALSALDEIRVKLYAPANSLVKMGLSFVVAILVFGMAEGFINKYLGSLNQDTQIHQVTPTSVQPLPHQIQENNPSVRNFSPNDPPPTSSEEIQKTIDQLQHLKALQDEIMAEKKLQAQPQQEQQVQVEEQLSPSDKLLQGLN